MIAVSSASHEGTWEDFHAFDTYPTDHGEFENTEEYLGTFSSPSLLV